MRKGNRRRIKWGEGRRRIKKGGRSKSRVKRGWQKEDEEEDRMIKGGGGMDPWQAKG